MKWILSLLIIMMSLSQALAEASLNPIKWITTRTGAHIPIEDNGFAQTKTGALFSSKLNVTIDKQPVIKGQYYTNRNDVIKVVNSISPRMANGLKITYSVSAPNLSDYGDSKNLKGVTADYSYKNNTITFYPTNYGEANLVSKATAAHEIGHHIANRMTIEQNLEWQKIHSQDKNYVTDYAESDFGEDFAESFAFWKLPVQDRIFYGTKRLSDSRRKFFEDNFGKNE